jgi:hypothetical protein
LESPETDSKIRDLFASDMLRNGSQEKPVRGWRKAMDGEGGQVKT